MNEFAKHIQDDLGIDGFAHVSMVQSKPYLITATDGVGTKLELARHFNKYDTIGIDLVAMVVNDIMVHGGTPDLFLDYYALGIMDVDIAKEIIKGIKKGCEIAGCKLVGGETAEMPLIYKDGQFDLAGFGVGSAQAKDLRPKNILPGDIIIGLPSSGLHSNGFTLINTLKPKKEYLKPTKIYTECLELLPLVLGFAHITGGGMKNIDRVVKNYKLIDWEFPKIFQQVQKQLNMSRDQMLSTFNCGYGMVAIISPEKYAEVWNTQIDIKTIGEVI